MNNYFIIALVVILLLYINKPCCMKQFENFATSIPSMWNKLATHKCKELDERMKDPNYLMDKHCTVPVTMKERDAINSGITCLNNVNREIFTDREQMSWCASAKNTETNDIGFYYAQPNYTTTNENKIVDNNLIKDTKEVFNYDLISGDNFMPTEYEKEYALIQ